MGTFNYLLVEHQYFVWQFDSVTLPVGCGCLYLFWLNIKSLLIYFFILKIQVQMGKNMPGISVR